MTAFQHPLDLLIEVGGDSLRFVELGIFGFRFLLCGLSGNAPLVRKYFISAKGQKLIYAGGKFLHREGVFPLDQVFDVVEIASDGALQLTDLFFLEIVFRDGDI